jgi:hypothetical protein
VRWESVGLGEGEGSVSLNVYDREEPGRRVVWIRSITWNVEKNRLKNLTSLC